MNQSEIQALAKGMVPFVRECVTEAVAPLVAKIAELEAREPLKGEKGDKGDVGEKGDRGDSGEHGDIGPLGPAGERGEKGDRGDAGECGIDGERGEKGEAGEQGEKGDAGAKGEKGDPGEPGQPGDPGGPGEKGEKGEPGIDGFNGKDGRDGIDGKDADPELIERSIAEAVAKIPLAKDGRDGLDGLNGRDGKDAEPITREQVVEAILAMPDVLNEAVAKHVAMDPPPAGKDGKDGRDGVGLSGAVIDHEGALVLTMADGSVHKVGIVVGRKGDPGRDGRGLDAIEKLEDERTHGIRFGNGSDAQEVVWEKASLLDRYRGVWRDGNEYQHNDIVQSRGSMYAAKCDTKGKPFDSDDWVLVVKGGRDGKDFRPTDPKPPRDPIRFS